MPPRPPGLAPAPHAHAGQGRQAQNPATSRVPGTVAGLTPASPAAHCFRREGHGPGEPANDGEAGGCDPRKGTRAPQGEPVAPPSGRSAARVRSRTRSRSCAVNDPRCRCEHRRREAAWRRSGGGRSVVRPVSRMRNGRRLLRCCRRRRNGAASRWRICASRNLDPKLHTHAVVANMTRDGEGRWKSIEPTGLHRNAILIGAYYR